MMNNRILIISLIAISLFSLAVSLSGSITNSAPLFAIEDTAIGSLLRIVNYTSQDGHEMKIEATSADAIDLIHIPDPTSNNPAHFHLTLKKKLDRDRKASIRYLNFKIIDTTAGDEVTLRIDMIIQDVNDERPLFEGEPYNTQIPENLATGHVILTVIATDPDSGLGGVITFAMELLESKGTVIATAQPVAKLWDITMPETQANAAKEEYRKRFSIDERTGEVKLNGSLDYESNTFYQYTVSAQESDDSGDSDIDLDEDDQDDDDDEEPDSDEIEVSTKNLRGQRQPRQQYLNDSDNDFKLLIKSCSLYLYLLTCSSLIISLL